MESQKRYDISKKGAVIMRVVNPVGRKIDSEAAANLVRACYCGTDSGFAVANTENGPDNCFHCGCSCELVQSGGTEAHASVVFRTSSL